MGTTVLQQVLYLLRHPFLSQAADKEALMKTAGAESSIDFSKERCFFATKGPAANHGWFAAYFQTVKYEAGRHSICKSQQMAIKSDVLSLTVPCKLPGEDHQ